MLELHEILAVKEDASRNVQLQNLLAQQPAVTFFVEVPQTSLYSMCAEVEAKPHETNPIEFRSGVVYSATESGMNCAHDVEKGGVK